MEFDVVAYSLPRKTIREYDRKRNGSWVRKDEGKMSVRLS
jgi:hypothetical protein